MTLRTSSGKDLTAAIQIVPIAPALFAVGSDIAAAYAVQVAPGGAQNFDPVFTVQSGGMIVTTPLNVTQPGQVYLSPFGTGFDMAVNLQGVTLPAESAGPQNQYQALSQINVLLPASFAGTGVVNVSISVGGATSNSVVIAIQ